MPKEIKAFVGFSDGEIDLNPWPWGHETHDDLLNAPGECFGIFQNEADAKRRYEDVRPVKIIVGDNEATE